jgi:hypothetical protein
MFITNIFKNYKTLRFDQEENMVKNKFNIYICIYKLYIFFKLVIKFNKTDMTKINIHTFNFVT